MINMESGEYKIMLLVFFTAAAFIDATIIKVMDVNRENLLILAIYNAQKNMINKQILKNVTKSFEITLILKLKK